MVVVFTVKLVPFIWAAIVFNVKKMVHEDTFLDLESCSFQGQRDNFHLGGSSSFQSQKLIVVEVRLEV